MRIGEIFTSETSGKKQLSVNTKGSVSAIVRTKLRNISEIWRCDDKHEPHDLRGCAHGYSIIVTTCWRLYLLLAFNYFNYIISLPSICGRGDLLLSWLADTTWGLIRELSSRQRIGREFRSDSHWTVTSHIVLSPSGQAKQLAHHFQPNEPVMISHISMSNGSSRNVCHCSTTFPFLSRAALLRILQGHITHPRSAAAYLFHSIKSCVKIICCFYPTCVTVHTYIHTSRLHAAIIWYTAWYLSRQSSRL